MTSILFFLLFFAIVVTYAAWRGGAPERWASLAYVTALLASASGGFVRIPGEFRVVPLHLVVTDLVLLVALTWLAVRANRWWIIWAAGCQLITVLGHAVRLIDPAMVPEGYAFLIKLWSWPMVALLGLGTWAHQRRLSRGIFAPDWKPSSGPPPLRNRQGSRQR